MGVKSTICLVVPDDAHTRLYCQVPIDILHAAAEFRTRGYEVFVWDRRIQTEAPDCTPTLVAIVTATSDRAQCYPLDLGPAKTAVECSRHHFPGVPELIYGPHANHLPEDTLAVTGADVVARGEHEGAVVAAAEAIHTKSSVAIPSILPSTEVSFVSIEPRNLPQPAYDLVDLHSYYAEVVDNRGTLRQGTAGLILALRGCPYQCSFCHLPFGRHLRYPELSRVLAEIEIYQTNNIENLFFLDYVFGIDTKFYSKLCNGLVSKMVHWIGQTRPEVVLRNDVEQWYAAGCRAIWLGAESHNVVNASVRKPITASQVEAAIAKLNQAGIMPLLFIMIGLPNESQKTISTLANWIKELPVGFIVNQLTLRPGTSLYNELAPTFSGGVLPSTWTEVERVNKLYRQQFDINLDDVEVILRDYPNHLSNRFVQALSRAIK